MVDWRNSKEKKKLRKNIISGELPDDMPPNIAYDVHDGIYHKFRFSCFKINLNNLRNDLKQLNQNAQEDEVVLLNTLRQKKMREMMLLYLRRIHNRMGQGSKFFLT